MTPELIKEIIQSIKDKYKEDFTILDDRAYFMCGFVDAALNQLLINKQAQ